MYYNSDFKHRERRERERRRDGLRENPNDRLRMTGGKISGVLLRREIARVRVTREREYFASLLMQLFWF